MADNEYVDNILYKAWLEEVENEIQNKDIKQIEEYILMHQRMAFKEKVQIRVAHAKREKMLGREWHDASKNLSDPNFKVNFDADPRKETKARAPKQSKEEKNTALLTSAGIDMEALKANLKAKMLEKAAKGKT